MSTETIPAFPLQWPAGWKRTPLSSRTRARFGKASSGYGGYTSRGELTVAQATDRVLGELRRMGVHDFDLVISSNLQLRLDGLPRSGQRDPEDPGVAVYWRDSSQDGWPMRCMAVDRYDRVADNLAAIAATLDAMRAIERHGGAEVLNRAFTGFAALPGAGGTEHWSDVLEVDERASREEIEAAYRRLRSQHHPDRGGDADEFHRITKAYEEACSA
ncbi:J domain-containing protein [Dyella sp. KRB-257]|uniref:J domain-containing protein n=1 Tax=Dyella sp. KRB-257 TaxID=3400915 RepID=UPI003BFF43A7